MGANPEAILEMAKRLEKKTEQMEERLKKIEATNKPAGKEMNYEEWRNEMSKLREMYDKHHDRVTGMMMAALQAEGPKLLEKARQDLRQEIGGTDARVKALEARLAAVASQLEDLRKSAVGTADLKAALLKIVDQEKRLHALEAKG